MTLRNTKTTFNRTSIERGDFLRIEFEPDLPMWVMVNEVMPRSVKATILERGQKPYLQGRAMDVYLEHAREYWNKDNAPPLWGTFQAE
jgi:hypothetical protein